MATIRLENIKKTYEDGTTVIENLNLDIKDKEFIILVGPSGCGKSTTLRMIAGLEEISDGNLYIGDKRVNDVSPKDRDIAMVFQNYALYPHMSVYKNMAFGLKNRKVPKDEIDRKVKEAAKMLDIEEYLHRKPRALSGGQRQRVALGRAMVREPSVFLLDEPLSNLDAKLRTEMRNRISILHRKLQTTFVYVTHDQTEAMTMADRIVVLKKGEVMQFDTPSVLYNHPKNMFVAGFIGSPQMNFLDTRIEVIKNSYFAVSESFKIRLSERMYDALSLYRNKDVILGIRPDDLHINNGASNENNPEKISAHIDIVEMTGSDYFLYGNTGNQKITAKVTAAVRFNDDTDCELSVDTDKIHIFDKVSEILICD